MIRLWWRKAKPRLHYKEEFVARFVKDYLTTNGIEYTSAADGAFLVPYETTLVTIRVASIPVGDGNLMTIIRLWALVAVEVPASPQLYRYIALSNEDFLFGGLAAAEERSLTKVYFNYSILAEHLDEAEFGNAIAVVAKTADSLDETVTHSFGGRRALDFME